MPTITVAAPRSDPGRPTAVRASPLGELHTSALSSRTAKPASR